MQQLEIGEEKTIAREEGSQVMIMMMAITMMVKLMTTMMVKVMTTTMEMMMIWDDKALRGGSADGIYDGCLGDLVSLFSNIIHKANMMPF